ncbi:hypothetical protein [Domibacillus epiphyticus]|nr:hypothetical protein [Domibacillus epiphyticus]
MNIADSSNYSRFSANLDFVNRILQGDFLVMGNGTTMDEQSHHRPHNAFFRAMYRYGFIVGLIAILIFNEIMNKYVKNNFEIIGALMAYYMLLNDFITGNELILTLLILLLIVNKKSFKNPRVKEVGSLSS